MQLMIHATHIVTVTFFALFVHSIENTALIGDALLRMCIWMQNFVVAAYTCPKKMQMSMDVALPTWH